MDHTCGRREAVDERGELSSLVTDPELYKSGTTWSTCGDCKAHTGFLQECTSLQTCIEQAVTAHHCGSSEKPARVARDFLGTALAGFAGTALHSYGHPVEELHTSDMSRTGHEIWAKDFNAKFSNRLLRVTRHRQLFAFERATARGL